MLRDVYKVTQTSAHANTSTDTLPSVHKNPNPINTSISGSHAPLLYTRTLTPTTVHKNPNPNTKESSMIILDLMLPTTQKPQRRSDRRDVAQVISL